jgi:hypothetical protein
VLPTQGANAYGWLPIMPFPGAVPSGLVSSIRAQEGQILSEPCVSSHADCIVFRLVLVCFHMQHATSQIVKQVYTSSYNLLTYEAEAF